MSTYKFHESTSVTRVLSVEADDLNEAHQKHANGEYEVTFTDAGLEPGESDWELDYVTEPDDAETDTVTCAWCGQQHTLIEEQEYRA